jgi:chromate transport protein ChrA
MPDLAHRSCPQFKQLFVEKIAWVEQPLFEELFGIVQVLSGPASTKMHYCINLHRSGPLLAIMAFFLWS